MRNPMYSPMQSLPLSAEALADKVRAAMARVYVWMTLGLLVTGVTAFSALTLEPLFTVLANPIVMIGLIIAELALVVILSATINRLQPGLALGLFFGYALLNGLTLALVFAAYTLGSVATIFFASACLFGAMSVVGYTTQRDLTGMGNFLLMTLFGLIIGSVVNMFFANQVLDWILTYVGIGIFIGLTAYHTQRVKKMLTAALAQGDEVAEQRAGIIGALALYLDFINLFLRLLRAFGRRR